MSQYMPLHWGEVTQEISVDGQRPSNAGVGQLQGSGGIPKTSGTGQASRISGRGGVGNVIGTGRNKRSGGSGGTCG